MRFSRPRGVNSNIYLYLYTSATNHVPNFQRLTLDWWTTSRDFGVFCFAIICFVFFTLFGISWSIKSGLLITFYIIYLIYLSCDKFVQDQLRGEFQLSAHKHFTAFSHPLLDMNEDTRRTGPQCFHTHPTIVPVVREKFSKYEEEENLEIILHPCRWPTSGVGVKVLWLVSWPLQVLFILTIPDCRRKSARSCFALTVLICIIWVTFFSYIVTWCATIFSKCVW